MNPFRYGALALDEAFTNREDEIRELTRDILNGQDVVVLAPRRYGKTSLVWRVVQEVVKLRRGLDVWKLLLDAFQRCGTDVAHPAKLRSGQRAERADPIASPPSGPDHTNRRHGILSM